MGENPFIVGIEFYGKVIISYDPVGKVRTSTGYFYMFVRQIQVSRKLFRGQVKNVSQPSRL